MKTLNTRFSYERRVKLILMCIITVVSGLVMSFGASSEISEISENTEMTLSTESADTSETPEQSWGRLNLIRTSRTDDNYSIFETQRDKISARGVYTDDNIRKIYIDSEKAEMPGSYSLSAHKDGSYEAEISCEPAEGSHKLVVKLNSGTTLRYQMFYDKTNGWYFPVNGYAQTNPHIFDHIFEAPAEASALYLSPTKDTEEISVTLEQISTLAEQITGGLESDYDKARAISHYIAARLYYDDDAKETDVSVSTIALCNVLKTGRTVCAGFTNLFCAMAESVGIDAVNVKGGVANGVTKYEDLPKGLLNHEWAAFYCKDEARWVWVDACWDGNGEYKNGEFKESLPKYMYFDITEEALSLDHRAAKAERRHYFAAKTETSIIGAETEESGESEPVITSQQTETAQNDVSDTTLETEENEVTVREDKPETPSEDADTVYVIVIAALAAAVVAVGAILIIIIVKGRKI